MLSLFHADAVICCLICNTRNEYKRGNPCISCTQIREEVGKVCICLNALHYLHVPDSPGIRTDIYRILHALCSLHADLLQGQAREDSGILRDLLLCNRLMVLHDSLLERDDSQEQHPILALRNSGMPSHHIRFPLFQHLPQLCLNGILKHGSGIIHKTNVGIFDHHCIDAIDTCAFRCGKSSEE